MHETRKLTMISRNVGPLWIYCRQPFEILNSFHDAGFCYIYGEDLFLDSNADKQLVQKYLDINPALRRHLKVPIFNVLVLEAKS
jgi:hypothetical protein